MHRLLRIALMGLMLLTGCKSTRTVATPLPPLPPPGQTLPPGAIIVPPGSPPPGPLLPPNSIPGRPNPPATFQPRMGTPITANRPPCNVCGPDDLQPSVFTPAPTPNYPPANYPPNPLPSGPVNPPTAQNPFGRLPPRLPDFMPQPPSSGVVDPWRADSPMPANVPGPMAPLPPMGPPRVIFGTPYPSTEEPPIAPANPRPRPPLLPPDSWTQPQPNPILPPAPTPPIPSPVPEMPKPILPPDAEVNRKPLSVPSPVDLQGFYQAGSTTGIGRQPFLDGVNWLSNQGYRSVIYLRPPGKNDEAARRQFEGKGFRYFSFEVSPSTINRTTLDAIQVILFDRANQSVYIYDTDGDLTGGLWYLRLRLIDGLDANRALEEAQKAGLNSNLGGAHRDMWNAIRAQGER